MSATNRGAVRSEHDFYATPRWCVDIILRYLPLRGLILEPSAGEGAITKVLLAAGVDGDNITALEIDKPRCERHYINTLIEPVHANFLEYAFPEQTLDSMGYDLVVTNPPYTLAEEFVDKSLSLVKPGGTVAMFLRVGFVEAQCRKAFWKKNKCDLYILGKRPSFFGGGTDASAYAWFLFGPGRGGHWERLDLEE